MINSAEEFCRLRLSENPLEYEQAVQDEAPLEVWLEVIEKYPEMRQWVAHNKKVPVEILVILSEDPAADVRCSVAAKRKLPGDLQLKLARDSDFSVRHTIVFNRKATKPALEVLAEDSEEAIRSKARERLNHSDYQKQ